LPPCLRYLFTWLYTRRSRPRDWRGYPFPRPAFASFAG
jgi:hypothetical protein